MKENPFNKEHHLRTKLDEYHVNIPDFPMKPNRWERFIRLLASPAKDPLEPLISTSNGLMLLKLGPIAGTGAIGLLQILFLL